MKMTLLTRASLLDIEVNMQLRDIQNLTNHVKKMPIFQHGLEKLDNAKQATPKLFQSIYFLHFP